MYKRLLTFLMLFAVSPVNLFADDTAGNASMSGALVINPGAETADCTINVLGTDSGNVRFNARFTPKRYTVTYATDSYGSGTGVSDGDIIFEEDTYTVKAEGAGTGLSGITSNVGYHFVNWLGSSDDTEYTQGTTYNSGHEFNPYNIAGDLTLTALHVPNETIIRYDCGTSKAGNAPADVIATYGEKFIFAENTCVLDGHDFDKWYCVGEPGKTKSKLEYGSGEVVDPWNYTGKHKGTVTCTAQWKLAEYAIHYRTDEGSGSMRDTSANYGQQNVTLSQNAFMNNQHFFSGWNCVADKDNSSVTVNTVMNNGTTVYKIAEMPASNVTCTAKWDYYAIIYYGCVDSLDNCTGNNRVDLSSNFPAKTKYAPGYIVTYPTVTELNALSGFDGYTFNGGWYFNTGASAGTSTEIRTGNLTLYTVMKPLYSVSYRCDENETGTEQDKYAKDSIVTAKTNDDCTPESGYSFDGWNCDRDVGIVAEGETFTMPANNVMCTAIFTPNDYVLKYDCNIPQQPKEILYSDNLHVNENVNAIDYYERCENAGYEFSGWNCNNGVGNVAQGQEFTMPANDVTCIAEIEKMQFTLSYECEKADGGTVPSSQTGYYLDVLGLAENTCEKTGSTFTGWHCSDGTTYNSGDTITLQADTICKSQWDTNKYSVTYECGEGALGNPPVDGNTYEFNVSVTTKLKTDGTCQRTGQTFTNWKCGNVEVAAGSDFNITHDTTCVAQWSDNTYKLTYKHGLHGTGADYVENVVFGTEHTVLTADDAGMTANDGYEFDVWNCGVSVGNKYPNDTITMPANDVTCTAQWKLIDYVIRYLPGDGSGNMANTSANYGQQNVTLSQNAFVNDYHFFSGWNCVADKDNSGVTVNTVTNNGTTVYKIAEMPASNVTCTAKWDYYAIIYYGCVDSLDNCTGNNRVDLNYFPGKDKYAPGYIVTYPTVTELNALSGFDGYTFNGGWYFNTGASAGTSTEIRTGNLTLYTVMTQDKYTITYKPGNAGARVVSGENKVRKVVYGGTQYVEPAGADLKTLAADTFSVVGYTFDKWLSNKNVATGVSANVEYDAEVDIALYNMIGNTEMTAQWKPNHYTVTYIIGEHAQDESTFIDTYDEDTQSGGATYDARYDIITEAILAAEPIKGYEFVGWTTDSTPSFTNGALNNQWNGETIWTRDDDLTVYAAYKPKSYTISYNCGTGTTNSLESVTGVPPASQNVEYMGEYSLAENENECVLPGAYFIGWRCDYNFDNGYGIGTTYLKGGDTVEKTGSFIIDDDVTCSALWYDYQYDVTYDCNGADEGSVAPTDDASYYYMHNAQAKDNLVNGNPACVRKNYDFDGWNCGGVDVNVGASFVITQDTTCDARWTYMCCDADAGQYLDTETGTCETKPEHSHLVDNMCSEGYECDMGYKLTDDGYCEIDKVEIYFDCGHGNSRVNKGVYGTTTTAPGEELCCDNGYCEVYGWNCDNGEWYRAGDDENVGDAVPFLDGENLECFADIEFNIRYKVYMTNDGVNWNEVNQVVVGGNTVNVSDLQPDKYRLDVHVAYPQISLQGYTFEGWYDYFDGEGFDDKNKVTMTPDYNDQGELWIFGKLVKRAPCVINYHNVDGATNNSNVSTYMVDGGAVNLNSATKQYYRFNGWHLGSPNGQVVDQIVPDGSTCGIDLYAEWEFECNEKGHEHWLHVGDSENDKICLYENRPYQNAAIVVVKGTSSDMNYYMMLSNDRNTLMHEGSNKKLRVMHNGTPYNACDMSTCAP